jgi:hypothetical protein
VIGWTCSTRGREAFPSGFIWGKLKKRNNLEDLGIDGKVILKWNFKE